jgi:hypothetical protein
MTFLDLLRGAERQNDSMLCVGLDPDPARFPLHWRGDASKMYDFCAAIADATADLVLAFKPQIAYFAAHRAEDQLERLLAHMRQQTLQLVLGAVTLAAPPRNTRSKPSSAMVPTRSRFRLSWVLIRCNRI